MASDVTTDVSTSDTAIDGGGDALGEADLGDSTRPDDAATDTATGHRRRGGCGCAIGPSGPPTGLAVLALVGALLSSRRRRRPLN